MACFREMPGQKLLYLRALHIFGRNPSRVDTVLGNGDASQIHASVRWNGRVWELTDHSRNGTEVDGQRLPANLKVELRMGQEIRFGPMAATRWTVTDLTPPGPMLLSMQDGGDSIALHDFHFLPDEQVAQASVSLSLLGHWQYEDEQGSRLLQDGDILQLGVQSWQFFYPQLLEVTADAYARNQGSALDIRFDFSVSQNEEHIYLSIICDGRVFDLGERTHHYTLLTLARKRVADAGLGLDAASQGWIAIEQLSEMLGLEPPHLNTQLFRARNQIARECAAVSQCVNVVERRRGEVRFGAFRFQIVRGMQLEAEFTPPKFNFLQQRI